MPDFIVYDHHIERLERLESKLDQIHWEVRKMGISQDQFDTDLNGLVSSVGTLIDTVNSAIAAKPQADLTAEDQQVLAAASAVSDELTALNPSTTPTPPPATTPPPDTTTTTTDAPPADTTTTSGETPTAPDDSTVGP